MTERELPEGIVELPDNLDIDPELKSYLEMMDLWRREAGECNMMWE